MRSVRYFLPSLPLRPANGVQFFHVSWPSSVSQLYCRLLRALRRLINHDSTALDHSVGLKNVAHGQRGSMGTYGTISSFKPLMNRIGMSVIEGRTSLLGQIW